MNELFRIGCMFFTMSALSACQSGAPAKELKLSSMTKPLPLIVSIGKSMQKCWMKGNNAAFRPYRLANETNSYAGRPRLLLVPKNKPTGLPSLVVQVEEIGGSTRLQAFGPLLSTNAGQAISNDLKNWTLGSSACANKS